MMRVRFPGILALTVALIIIMFPLNLRPAPASPPVGGRFVDGAFLVKFRRDLPQTAVDALNRQLGARAMGQIPSLGVFRLATPPGRSVSETVRAYRSLADVEFAEPDYIAQAYDTVPNDVYFSQQWGLSKIKLPAAWDLDRGNSAVVVAVVDTGVYADHPDLQGRVLQGYNFVNDSTVTTDDHGHGTHLAGIIGAITNNTTGVAGGTWQATILPVKVLDAQGDGTYSAIASGIVYAADHRAEVINLSLGGYTPSETLRLAVDYAWSKGAVLTCAVGNSSGPIAYPAAYSNCLAVGATGRDDQRMLFSNYGLELDVMAPGDAILSTVPEHGCALCNPGGYVLLSGTSMAAPHAAALAALLFTQFPGASNADVRNQIEAQADDLGDPGWDRYYGYGRINAYRALATPLSPPVPPPPPALSLVAGFDSPKSGDTVSGAAQIQAFVSGGASPYHVQIALTSRNRSRSICDVTTSTYTVTCLWQISKGLSGSQTLTLVASDQTTQVTGSVTVTVRK